MTDKRWFHPKDAQARATFDALQERLGPLIAELLPSFRLTFCGFDRMPAEQRFIEGRDEIHITLHLRPLGEAYAIQARLEAMAAPDPLPCDAVHANRAAKSSPLSDA